MQKRNIKVARLLDANLNRAREGLRVVEDTSRFIWNDKSVYSRLRKLRHKLHTTSQAHYKNFVLSRNSHMDGGRTMKEGSRDTVINLACANLRRAEEAVRVLEEYGKLISSKAGASFKRIRYQLYDEEKRVIQKYG